LSCGLAAALIGDGAASAAVRKKKLKRYRLTRCMSSSSWLKPSKSETLTRKEYAFSISQKMFDTAHLLNSFEVPLGFDKLRHLGMESG
jgi:hypothetical protein